MNRTLYYNASQFLFNLALQANDAQDYFPIWGTCLGFEFLSIVVANDINVLTGFDAENISLPLQLTPYAARSRLFSQLENRQPWLAYLSHNNVTENYHHWGVGVDTFQANAALSTFYALISTSEDRNGLPFVSSVEALKYPIYAVQYHPERSLFEWDSTEQIDHSASTIAIMQYFGRFFVNEARQNSHAYPSADAEHDALIYNYSPIYTAKLFGFDEQMYVFPAWPWSDRHP